MRISTNLATIFTMMLLATASSVAAEPVDKESTARLSYTGRAQPRGPVPDAHGWIEVADPTPAKHGREFIAMGAAAGRFTRLRVDAHRGRPYVHYVRIEFADGSRKVARIESRLGRKGKRSTVIDLGGPREIQQIIVATDRDVPGMYTVHAAIDDGTSVATR